MTSMKQNGQLSEKYTVVTAVIESKTCVSDKCCTSHSTTSCDH